MNRVNAYNVNMVHRKLQLHFTDTHRLQSWKLCLEFKTYTMFSTKVCKFYEVMQTLLLCFVFYTEQLMLGVVAIKTRTTFVEGNPSYECTILDSK